MDHGDLHPAGNLLHLEAVAAGGYGVRGPGRVKGAVAWLMMGKEGPLVQTSAMAIAEPRIAYFRLLTARTFIGLATYMIIGPGYKMFSRLKDTPHANN